MAQAGWQPSPTQDGWVQWWDGKAWSDAFWRVKLPSVEYLPSLARWDVSVPGEPRFDIVGENWREREILAAVGRESTPRDQEFEGYGTAELVLEPNNPYDSNAVSVRVAGYCLGYLPSEVSYDYAQSIARLLQFGLVPTVRVRVWGVTRFVRSRGQDELKSAIRLALPTPDQMWPMNNPPAAPHYLVPRGRSVQVSGEQDHLEALRRWVKPRPTTVVVTLGRHTVERARSASEVIGVRLDGALVGTLSPASSRAIEPLLGAAEQDGRELAAWAAVSGSHLAAEVVLRMARAEEIPATWPSADDAFPSHATGPAVPPPSFTAQVLLTPPPPPRGLQGWAIALIVIAALLLAAVPGVGPILTLLAIAGAVVWHVMLKKRPPAQALTLRARAGEAPTSV